MITSKLELQEKTMYKSKRSLKVYEAPLGLNGKQQVPRIQLQGQWLEALGYHVGDKIDVQCTNDTIIINKVLLCLTEYPVIIANIIAKEVYI